MLSSNSHVCRVQYLFSASFMLQGVPRKVISFFIIILRKTNDSFGTLCNSWNQNKLHMFNINEV